MHIVFNFIVIPGKDRKFGEQAGIKHTGLRNTLVTPPLPHLADLFLFTRLRQPETKPLSQTVLEFDFRARWLSIPAVSFAQDTDQADFKCQHVFV